MNSLLRHILILLLTAIPTLAMAQREVTPVESDDKKPAAPVLHYYDKHGKPLDEPVLFLATLDTVENTAQAAKAVYPLLNSLEIGLNFADGILAIAGQKHGGADLWASLGLWNWVFPTVEIGLGGARDKPAGMNFTYKGKPSVYARLGADYNFLYKSNPDYKLLVGFRAGFSPFAYSIDDISISSPYWDQYQTISIPDQSSTAFWGEVGAGVRVRLWKQLALGWTFRYRFMFSCPDGSNSTPWYIPGYGTKNSHIGVTFSLVYTLPLAPKPAPAEDTE